MKIVPLSNNTNQRMIYNNNLFKNKRKKIGLSKLRKKNKKKILLIKKYPTLCI